MTSDHTEVDGGGARTPTGVPRSRSACAIAPALPAELPAITALLRESDLPYEDIAPHLRHFLVARTGNGNVVGAIGAEVCGSDALLRSLVVAPAYRGSGLGAELMGRLEQSAAGWGVERWWLLTLTAEKFFAARGFAPAAREQAPEAIRRTRQFAGGCCQSAVCLTRPRSPAA